VTEDQLKWAIWTLVWLGGVTFWFEVFRTYRSYKMGNPYADTIARERARHRYMQCMVQTAQWEVEVYGRVMSGSVESWLKDHNIEVHPKDEKPEQKDDWLTPEDGGGPVWQIHPGAVIQVPQGASITPLEAASIDFETLMGDDLPVAKTYHLSPLLKSHILTQYPTGSHWVDFGPYVLRCVDGQIIDISRRRC